jgi:hypothetical protein
MTRTGVVNVACLYRVTNGDDGVTVSAPRVTDGTKVLVNVQPVKKVFDPFPIGTREFQLTRDDAEIAATAAILVLLWPIIIRGTIVTGSRRHVPGGTDATVGCPNREASNAPDYRYCRECVTELTGLEKRWLHSWALGSIASGGASLLTPLYIVQLGAFPVGSTDWRPRLR